MRPRTAYDSGTICTYRVGNKTPAWLTCRRENVSGMVSFLSADCRTSVKVSSEAPTRTRKSFILHGWASRGQRWDHFLIYMELTFVELENTIVSSRTCPATSKSRKFWGWNDRDRREFLTFPKVMLSATRSARNVSSVGDESGTELSTASLSNLKVTHCLTCGICEAPLHRLVESAGSSRKMFEAT